MEWQLRKAMVAIGREIHARGLVAASDGNLSARLGDERVLMTPSGVSLGHLRTASMVVIDHRGRQLAGEARPSSEYRLHLAVYAERADVQAVVHAHPPIANGFTFAGVPLDACVVPEVVATLGNIPTTEYATPSTQEGADVIRAYIRAHDAVMLQRHGSVTVGKTLRSAYHNLEKLEHTAQVLLTARQLGHVQPLSPEEIAKLAALREDLGLGPGADVYRACGVTELPP
jgi:L-fuculose-phosphate aldolase